MRSRQRALSVIAVPAGERQLPGWFALNPGQFKTEAERHAVHGRWHCLSSSHGRVFRALQFRDDLPDNGIALDWAARSLLEGDHRGAVAQSTALQLEIRPARWVEYPRCLFGHPNPTVRLASIAGLASLLLVMAFIAGMLLSGVSRLSPAQAPPPGVEPVTEMPTKDATAFIQQIVGDWQGPNEQLQIKRDKGVVELLRQAAPEKGEVQLDFYAAAPVRLNASERWLELETPDGIWRIALVPGANRAGMRITYPDSRQVLYE